MWCAWFREGDVIRTWGFRKGCVERDAARTSLASSCPTHTLSVASPVAGDVVAAPLGGHMVRSNVLMECPARHCPLTDTTDRCVKCCVSLCARMWWPSLLSREIEHYGPVCTSHLTPLPVLEQGSPTSRGGPVPVWAC